MKKAFDEFKRLLMDSPVMVFPSYDRGFFLYTDASDIGVGATLAEKDGSGKERTVAFSF